jgi:predicted nucleic acid-binding protein
VAQRRPRLISSKPYAVLDTDTFSVGLRGQLPDSVASALAGYAPCVTAVTVGELHKGAVLANWGQRRHTQLAARLQPMQVLPIDEDVGWVWGEVTAHAQQRGRPRPVNDSWIAATALSFGLPLSTLNRADFIDFVEHDGLVLLA